MAQGGQGNSFLVVFPENPVPPTQDIHGEDMLVNIL
jgi:hypothetical protein